jgi:hypothetical protein
MSKSARKSPETDKKGKALEAQPQKTGKPDSAQNPSTTPPPGIQARPALRAPGSIRTQHPRTAPHQEQAAGKTVKQHPHLSPKSLDR